MSENFPMTSEQYVEAKGTRCPFCGSTDLRGSFVNIEEGTAAQSITCGECRSDWTDVYELKGYEG